MNGTSAWESAIDRSDALDQAFAGGLMGPAEAKELRAQLLTVRQSAVALEHNASQVITLLDKRQGKGDINRSTLYTRYDAIYADLRSISTKIDRVSSRLTRIAKTSRAAATQAGSLSEVGDDVQRRFTAFADTVSGTAEPLATVGRRLATHRAELPAVATDTEYQSQLTKRWEKRKGAMFKVYVTVAEGVILFVAGAIALFERR